ncbi:NAD(P)/FAD-dependent oxidoreductase [Salinisphaera sp. Q1T1-3]|uniref:NAD(P)/FAD-dependent oxidoreductase n=1 Tax=Salinisphaera sp. Q1T1-3 TaxID=2321229 RepID=UPI00131409B7|nr:NAD(P)-binding protein [Salinisphaera sp. Q1T1-3]
MNDILIIGAGVAGMAAAEYLTAAGCRIQMVDKAGRPGGRCATRRVTPDTAADWFDYGAQYFTARSQTFRISVDRDLEAGRLVHWQPRINTAEPLGGTWLFSPSPDDRERLIGPRGMNHWVRDRLAQSGLHVACERRANALRRGSDGQWTARFDSGAPISASHVLLTPPASQTRALLAGDAKGIDVLDAAPRAMAACHSLVVAAPPIDGVDAIFFKSGKLSWAADNTTKAGVTRDRHLWTLHASTAFSTDHEDRMAEDLAAAMLAEFAAATALSVTDMEVVRARRWRFARPGSGAPDEDQRFWVDPRCRLAIAGDWLAGGRVEGAWLSGRGAAARLIGDV